MVMSLRLAQSFTVKYIQIERYHAEISGNRLSYEMIFFQSYRPLWDEVSEAGVDGSITWLRIVRICEIDVLAKSSHGSSGLKKGN